MQQYKQEFIEFLIGAKVLTFGEFVTKSGRQTPFFINTGKFCTGNQLHRLGYFYAEALCSIISEPEVVLFGPAYKGIPLVVATAIALQEKLGKDIMYCFNRKEVKDHGEGGMIIGHLPTSGERIAIIEDVITAGTSIRETVPLLLKTAPVILSGLVIAVDRMERGKETSLSALQEIRQEYSMPVGAIVTLEEIVTHLYNRTVGGVIHITESMKRKIDVYRETYGASA